MYEKVGGKGTRPEAKLKLRILPNSLSNFGRARLSKHDAHALIRARSANQDQGESGMKKTTWIPVVLASLACAMPGIATAQSKQGYWTEPAGGDAVWRSGTGLCWRAGYWTPAMATCECDKELLPREVCEPPAPKVAPPPPPPPPAKPAPAPAKPAPKPRSEE